MNLELEHRVSGKIVWLEVRDRHGKLKTRLENVPNLLMNGGIATNATINSLSWCRTMESTAESYDDIDGTWNQTENTITRATGTGIFPATSYPTASSLGDELYWFSAGSNTGHRCHVTARESDTSITVSGVPKTITGGRLRRFSVNYYGASQLDNFKQDSNTCDRLTEVYDDVAGTKTETYRVSFTSALTTYSLGSIASHIFRIKLPSAIPIDVDDQLQFEYTVVRTVTGRSQVYELGAESVGIPQAHNMLSVVGNGTYVDVTFAAPTHFLAGDKLDLRTLTTNKLSISSASSTSTTFTINTTLAHSLNAGDTVVIEGASVAGYNGTFTVATVVDTDTITITDASNPGAMSASGTIRLDRPSTYFHQLGLATVASMVSTSVARITSTITGPAVNPVAITGDPGITIKFRRGQLATGDWVIAPVMYSSYTGFATEADAKAIMDETSTGLVTGTKTAFDSQVATDAEYTNDFTHTQVFTKNAGVGTGADRIKQFMVQYDTGMGVLQVTLNTPFSKTEAQRLRFTVAMKTQRDLDLTGL